MYFLKVFVAFSNEYLFIHSLNTIQHLDRKPSASEPGVNTRNYGAI